MPRKVFWSWQSDVSARETRSVIRDALAAAIDRLAASLEDAERPEIDHDTRGVPGTPEIATTILEKIDVASVFVADLTPIAVSPSGKHLPNPNVLIELGYAKKSLTPSKMILVWNTAIYGSTVEDLPFDLRHRRGPISFALPIGAPKNDLKNARALLEKALSAALTDILSAVAPTPPAELPWHESDDAQPAVWAGNSAGLPVNHGLSDPAEIRVEQNSLGYARLLPASWNGRADALAILDNATQHPQPLGRYGSLNWGPTTRGFLVYRHNNSVEESGVTTTATRWFRDTGEFWGVDSQFCRDDGDYSYYSELYAAERWIGWLRQAFSFCQILGGSPPFHVRLGIEGLRGTSWARNNYGGSTPQALESSVHHRFELHTIADARDHVLATLNEVRSAFGLVAMSSNDLDDLASRFIN